MALFKYPDIPKEDSFGIQLLKAIVSGAAGTLVNKGIGHAFGSMENADARQVAASQAEAASNTNALKEEGASVKDAISSFLPETSVAKLMKENRGSPMGAIQANPPDDFRGARLPPEPVRPQEIASPESFVGPSSPDLDKEKFYWQAKDLGKKGMFLNKTPVDQEIERVNKLYAEGAPEEMTMSKDQRVRNDRSFLSRLKAGNQDEMRQKDLDRKITKDTNDYELNKKKAADMFQLAKDRNALLRDRVAQMKKNAATKESGRQAEMFFKAGSEALRASYDPDKGIMDVTIRKNGIALMRKGLELAGLNDAAKGLAHADDQNEIFPDDGGDGGMSAGAPPLSAAPATSGPQISDETVKAQQAKSPALGKMSLEEARAYLQANRKQPVPVE